MRRSSSLAPPDDSCRALHKIVKRRRQPEAKDYNDSAQPDQGVFFPDAGFGAGRPGIRPENQSRNMNQKARKDHHQENNEQHGWHIMTTIEACAKDGEFALEQAERWRADYGKCGHQKQRSGDRHGVNQPALCPAELVRFQMLLDISSAEEQERLRDGMERHMQQHAQGSQRTAKCQTQYHDSAVVDARISQKPAETPLHKNKWHRD